MRALTGIGIVGLFMLAGCTGSQTSLLVIGNSESFSEDDGEEFDGLFYEWEDVQGAGVHNMKMACGYGFAGIERDGGNGTVSYTLTSSNATFYSGSVGPDDDGAEDFGALDNNVTVTMRVETTSDFTGELAFGMACWGFDDF